MLGAYEPVCEKKVWWPKFRVNAMPTSYETYENTPTRTYYKYHSMPTEIINSTSNTYDTDYRTLVYSTVNFYSTTNNYIVSSTYNSLHQESLENLTITSLSLTLPCQIAPQCHSNADGMKEIASCLEIENALVVTFAPRWLRQQRWLEEQ